MADVTEEQIQSVVDNLATGIRRVTSESGSTEMQTITQQIQGLQYLQGLNQSKSRFMGIRVKKVRTGNALGDA